DNAAHRWRTLAQEGGHSGTTGDERAASQTSRATPRDVASILRLWRARIAQRPQRRSAPQARTLFIAVGETSRLEDGWQTAWALRRSRLPAHARSGRRWTCYTSSPRARWGVRSAWSRRSQPDSTAPGT